MKKTVKEIAELINGEVVGDKNIVITGISGIKEAKEGDITFLANPKYAPLMETTKASCIIAPKDVEPKGKATLIKADNPDLGFAKVVSLLSPLGPVPVKGISSLASISKNAKLGKNVSVGPFAVVEDDAEIGDNTIIYAGAYIGNNAKIGKSTILYPHVSIREKCVIGDSVIMHSGVVIGSDGFGFATVAGVHHKIPQIGIVIVEDNVEIGANVTIDRARFGKTVIGKGTKIDNLVQIAHNVVIGENSIIVAQAGISGSTTIGKNVIMAGQSGIVGHVEIGDNTIIAAQSGISKSLDKNIFVIGSPARPQNIWKRINASMGHLPELLKTVSKLSKKVKVLEEKVYGKTEDNKERS
ncbi:MAG: UDP-3-O-(3-hydroxymyristoyl)glucosamine N-acyltransferase [Candidatus Omnitrophica bacterium CG07_land_8_20_14_0_80_42_15]|uniref:UDP-3-O-acylglucosamine N-acyltransferase n=1 Tax=Candidatus Aquitaenariimonas noxiae TaxID=1974741 RepID=A0A2J0KY85_9BACT|nr:MAG: UDP-3-O-(3-hydroxymyristoyl)glucosamine N-acyltransferase [Candidatus Omnitrophica bacterium CG07_land_8_20_14_0_80_42_15]